MRKIFLVVLFLILSSKSIYSNTKFDNKIDSVQSDSINKVHVLPVNIFYELLGSSVWMSLNYQQTLFSKNRYSLDFLTGINNWEFSEYDFVNSHYFLLNRFSNKSRRFFIEFGPGFKLGGSLGERKLGYDFSWNTSIMKVFRNNMFFKFNTTFSLSYLYIITQDPNSEATFYYGYASFPIGFSLGYRFNERKSQRNEKNEQKMVLPKNLIGINSILGLSFDRLLLRKKNHALYLSVNPNFYVFKKFDVSEKTGYLLLNRSFINYVQQIDPLISTEFGLGNTYYYEKFSVFDKMLSINTSQINLNLGIRIMPSHHSIIKINYSPAIWASNYNLTYNDNFIYYQLNQNRRHKIADKFFITLGYTW
ncbi:MAG: hypothetical protein Fur0028_02820 [Bacteroidales bacterium]